MVDFRARVKRVRAQLETALNDLGVKQRGATAPPVDEGEVFEFLAHLGRNLEEQEKSPRFVDPYAAGLAFLGELGSRPDLAGLLADESRLEEVIAAASPAELTSLQAILAAYDDYKDGG